MRLKLAAQKLGELGGMLGLLEGGRLPVLADLGVTLAAGDAGHAQVHAHLGALAGEVGLELVEDVLLVLVGDVLVVLDGLGVHAVLMLGGKLQLTLDLLEHGGRGMAHRALRRGLGAFVDVTADLADPLCRHRCSFLSLRDGLSRLAFLGDLSRCFLRAGSLQGGHGTNGRASKLGGALAKNGAGARLEAGAVLGVREARGVPQATRLHHASGDLHVAAEFERLDDLARHHGAGLQGIEQVVARALEALEVGELIGAATRLHAEALEELRGGVLRENRQVEAARGTDELGRVVARHARHRDALGLGGGLDHRIDNAGVVLALPLRAEQIQAITQLVKSL